MTFAFSLRHARRHHLLQALLSASGTEATREQATRLWDNRRGWRELLFSMDACSLGYGGLAPAQEKLLGLLREVALRILRSPVTDPPLFLDNSAAVYACVREMEAFSQEALVAISLDPCNRLIRRTEVFRGTQSEAAASHREVIREALLADAAKLVIVHNHPSGDTHPSEEDARFTVELSWAGEIVGLPLVDHIIVGKGGYFSFADARLLSLKPNGIWSRLGFRSEGDRDRSEENSRARFSPCRQ